MNNNQLIRTIALNSIQSVLNKNKLRAIQICKMCDETNATRFKEDSATMDKTTCPTIDHLVYGALRDDLKTERHVDMVFSYYNETTGRVEYNAKCHRMALAAKSHVLRHLLCQSGLEENLSLTLVGTCEMTAAEDLIGLLYDPGKSGKDISLWDDDAPLIQKQEQYEEIQVKPEIDDSHHGESAWNYSHHDSKDDVMDDIRNDWHGEAAYPFKDEDEVEWPSDTKPSRRRRPPPKDKELPGIDISLQKTECGPGGPSLEKIATLVEEGVDVVGFHDYLQKRCGRFRAITYDGALTKYSCCKNCKAVVYFKYMHSHFKKCKIKMLKFPAETATSEEISPSQGQELRAKNRILANAIAHLLRTGSDKVLRYPPTEGELPLALSAKFDCVRHEGRVVPWVVCKSCSLLVLIGIGWYMYLPQPYTNDNFLNVNYNCLNINYNFVRLAAEVQEQPVDAPGEAQVQPEDAGPQQTHRPHLGRRQRGPPRETHRRRRPGDYT